MLSSFDYDLGFDPFNYVTVLLLCCGFIFLYMYFNCILFDFDFYYPRVNKDWLDGFANTIFTFTSPEQKEIVYIFIGRLKVH